MYRTYHPLYIISYILTILLFVLGAVFYRQPLVAVLLLLMVILVPISVFITLMCAERLEPDVYADKTTDIGVTQPVNLTIKLNNPTVVPLLNCRLVFSLGNSLMGSFENEMVMPAEAKRAKEVRIPIETSMPGMVRVVFSSLSVTDFLHFCTFTYPYERIIEFPVMPAERLLPPLKFTKVSIPSDEAVSTGDGDLTTDIKEVREYRNGDRLRDIHWKISARKDEIMVKEYDRTKDLYYVVLPEFEFDFLKDDMEIFYACGKELLKRKETFRVAIAGDTGDFLEMHKVASPEELDTVLYRIYDVYSGLKTGVSSQLYDIFCRQYPDMPGVIRIHRGSIVMPEIIEEY